VSNPNRDKGTAAERAVVRFAQELGMNAHRLPLHGADCGDVIVDRVMLQVKDYKTYPSDAQIDEWLTQTQRQLGNAKLARYDVTHAYLVVKRPGKAHPRDWHLYVPDNVGLGPICFRFGPWMQYRADYGKGEL
jgi:Holliday junction resolvase